MAKDCSHPDKFAVLESLLEQAFAYLMPLGVEFPCIERKPHNFITRLLLSISALYDPRCR